MMAAGKEVGRSEANVQPGKILLVGFGPGGAQQMTLRARAAIEEADVIIGYTTYIKLIADLIEGKEVVRKGMTEELDRCIEAWEYAKLGKTVALISSGDIGVYGMAGPTYEVLLQRGWTPDSQIKVEVIVGATALNSAASLVGAPLTHDFCSISLSDQLTPWSQIAARLKAAAEGNFVVALYNPKSGRRTQQIVQAQRILLKERSPDTPVAIVKSAYRRRQNIQRTTLENLGTCEIGMLCTVIVGNSHSYFQEGLMITPRGYQNKYDPLTGEAHVGERAGRPLSQGLAGWPERLLAHLESQKGMDLQEAAERLEMPLGDVLGVLAASQGRIQDERLHQIELGTREELKRFCLSGTRFMITQKWADAGFIQLRAEASGLEFDEAHLLVNHSSGSLSLALDSVEQIFFHRTEAGVTCAHLLDRWGNALLKITRCGGAYAAQGPTDFSSFASVHA